MTRKSVHFSVERWTYEINGKFRYGQITHITELLQFASDKSEDYKRIEGIYIEDEASDITVVDMLTHKWFYVLQPDHKGKIRDDWCDPNEFSCKDQLVCMRYDEFIIYINNYGLEEVKINDNYTVTELTHQNILDECVQFHKRMQLNTVDIVLTIEAMVKSNKYVIGNALKRNKLQLEDAQNTFKQLIAPESVSYDDIKNSIFT